MRTEFASAAATGIANAASNLVSVAENCRAPAPCRTPFQHANDSLTADQRHRDHASTAFDLSNRFVPRRGGAGTLRFRLAGNFRIAQQFAAPIFIEGARGSAGITRADHGSKLNA